MTIRQYIPRDGLIPPVGCIQTWPHPLEQHFSLPGQLWSLLHISTQIPTPNFGGQNLLWSCFFTCGLSDLLLLAVGSLVVFVLREYILKVHVLMGFLKSTLTFKSFI
jgi:hypothetical protein